MLSAIRSNVWNPSVWPWNHYVHYMSTTPVLKMVSAYYWSLKRFNLLTSANINSLSGEMYHK